MSDASGSTSGPSENDSSPNSQTHEQGQSDRRGSSRRRKVVVASIILVVIACIAGTGIYLKHRASVAEAERQQVAQRQEAAKEAKEAKEAKAAEEARKAQAAQEAQERLDAVQAEYDTCSLEIAPLLEDMKTVDARLDVGLSQSDFSELVGSASVSYGAMDVAELNGGCLPAGSLLETGLNKYIASVSKWSDCIYDDYCNMDDIDPELQRSWSAASSLIDRASAKLKAADPSIGQTT